MKASSFRMALDACTREIEKPSFAFTDSIRRKRPVNCTGPTKTMVYIPWRDESSDLLGGYMDFRSHYEDKVEDTLENEQQYTQNATEINADDLTEHTWSTPACMEPSSSRCS